MRKETIFYYSFMILAIITWLLLATYGIWERWISRQNLTSVSQLLSSLAAILNLGFVITIFNLNKRDKEKEETLARQSYWFRNIILDKNIDKVHDCFDKLFEYIDDINQDKCNDEEFLKNIELYQDNKRFLIRVISDMVRILDDNFADKLDEILDDHEDLFTEATQDLFTCATGDWLEKKKELEKSVHNLKKQFLKEIFIYEKNGYTSKIAL